MKKINDRKRDVLSILIGFFAVSLLIFLPRISTADPLDWHWRSPLPTRNVLDGVTWGNSTFVAVGYAGTILQSDPVTSVSADLSLTKTGSPNPAAVGGSLTYTVTVTNNGPDKATGVVMTDTLSASVTLVSATSSQGICSSSGTITCALGNLAKSATATVTIVVTPKAAGTIGNTASITGNETDQDTTNNTATITTTIISLLTLGASVLEGEVGVPYYGSLGISGGSPPYTVSIVSIC